MTLGAVLILSPFFTIAAGETIKNFDARVELQKDATVLVEEIIVYDFADSQGKHGIYRDIPVKYQTNVGNRSIKISEIGVKDENFEPYNFETTNKGNNLSIKIGDAEIVVSGIKTYIITYKVSGAINYFNDFDEFYWNVTGNGWQVPIARVSATLIFPESLETNKINFSCYVGKFGSQKSCQVSPIRDKQSVKSLFFAHNDLLAGEGKTFAASLPKGIIIEPGRAQKIETFLRDNYFLFLPILVFLIMLMLWYKKGRDQGPKLSIVPQYEPPPGLTPSEVGIILDEKIQPWEITAEIVALATKGYLKITRVEEKRFLTDRVDYVLKKIKNSSDLQSKVQKQILDLIFKEKEVVKISELKNKFFTAKKEIYKTINDEIAAKGYFVKSPSQVRSKTILIALASVFVISFIGIWQKFSGVASSSYAISVFIVIIFSNFMPSKTIKGSETKAKILGLKDYIKTAEKDRIKFHNAPEKSPERFEKLLPYAIVLRLEKQWAKQFESIYTEPPNWYGGYAAGHFSTAIFTNELSSFSGQVSTGIAWTGGSGSSGSGFSGGGGGGGGGGSW